MLFMSDESDGVFKKKKKEGTGAHVAGEPMLVGVGWSLEEFPEKALQDRLRCEQDLEEHLTSFRLCRGLTF